MTDLPQKSQGHRDQLPDREFLRPDEVAKFYSVSESTVRGWIRTGKLDAVEVGPRLKRIRRVDALKLQTPALK